MHGSEDGEVALPDPYSIQNVGRRIIWKRKKNMPTQRLNMRPEKRPPSSVMRIATHRPHACAAFAYWKLFFASIFLWVISTPPALAQTNAFRPVIPDWQIKGALAALNDPDPQIKTATITKLMQVESIDRLPRPELVVESLKSEDSEDVNRAALLLLEGGEISEKVLWELLENLARVNTGMISIFTTPKHSLCERGSFSFGAGTDFNHDISCRLREHVKKYESEWMRMFRQLPTDPPSEKALSLAAQLLASLDEPLGWSRSLIPSWLQSPNENVRSAAYRLELRFPDIHLSDDALRSRLESDQSVDVIYTLRYLEINPDIGRHFINHVAQKLVHNDENVVQGALDALSTMGAVVIPHLDAIKNASYSMRRSVFQESYYYKVLRQPEVAKDLDFTTWLPDPPGSIVGMDDGENTIYGLLAAILRAHPKNYSIVKSYVKDDRWQYQYLAAAILAHYVKPEMDRNEEVAALLMSSHDSIVSKALNVAQKSPNLYAEELAILSYQDKKETLDAAKNTNAARRALKNNENIFSNSEREPSIEEKILEAIRDNWTGGYSEIDVSHLLGNSDPIKILEQLVLIADGNVDDNYDVDLRHQALWWLFSVKEYLRSKNSRLRFTSPSLGKYFDDSNRLVQAMALKIVAELPEAVFASGFSPDFGMRMLKSMAALGGPKTIGKPRIAGELKTNDHNVEEKIFGSHLYGGIISYGYTQYGGDKPPRHVSFCEAVSYLFSRMHQSLNEETWRHVHDYFMQRYSIEPFSRKWDYKLSVLGSHTIPISLTREPLSPVVFPLACAASWLHALGADAAFRTDQLKSWGIVDAEQSEIIEYILQQTLVAPLTDHELSTLLDASRLPPYRHVAARFLTYLLSGGSETALELLHWFLRPQSEIDRFRKGLSNQDRMRALTAFHAIWPGSRGRPVFRAALSDYMEEITLNLPETKETRPLLDRTVDLLRQEYPKKADLLEDYLREKRKSYLIEFLLFFSTLLLLLLLTVIWWLSEETWFRRMVAGSEPHNSWLKSRIIFPIRFLWCHVRLFRRRLLLPLDECFDLEAKLEIPVYFDGLEVKEGTKSHPIARAVEEKLRSGSLLLIGDSGSGKTYFCYHLTERIIRDLRSGGKGRVPLYFDLFTELNETGKAERDPLELLIQNRFRELMAFPDVLEALVREECILILDGLHDLHGSETFQNAFRSALSSRLRSYVILITSQPRGVWDGLKSKCEQLEIKRIAADRRRAYMEKWIAHESQGLNNNNIIQQLELFLGSLVKVEQGLEQQSPRTASDLADALFSAKMLELAASLIARGGSAPDIRAITAEYVAKADDALRKVSQHLPIKGLIKLATSEEESGFTKDQVSQLIGADSLPILLNTRLLKETVTTWRFQHDIIRDYFLARDMTSWSDDTWRTYLRQQSTSFVAMLMAFMTFDQGKMDHLFKMATTGELAMCETVLTVSKVREIAQTIRAIENH